MIKVYLILLLSLFSLVGCSNKDQPTIALALAVERSDIDQIKRHIEWGSNINQPIRQGAYPLHVATEHGRIIVVKLLAQHGARLDVEDAEGHTPLSRAIIFGRTQIARFLVKNGAEANPDQLLRRLVEAGASDRDAIRLLVEWGADLNLPGPDGESALTLAIRDGNRVLVKHLISNGANPNIPTAANELPLDIARATKHDEIIRLLVKNGAMGTQN